MQYMFINIQYTMQYTNGPGYQGIMDNDNLSMLFLWVLWWFKILLGSFVRADIGLPNFSLWYNESLLF